MSDIYTNTNTQTTTTGLVSQGVVDLVETIFRTADKNKDGRYTFTLTPHSQRHTHTQTSTHFHIATPLYITYSTFHIFILCVFVCRLTLAEVLEAAAKDPSFVRKFCV